MGELTALSAQDLARGYREKKFTAEEVTKAHLERIEKENTRLNAYLEVFDDALDAAKKADGRLAQEGAAAPLLTGIPISVKDNILIEGKRVSAASKMLEGYVAPYDATAIARLKTADVVFLGRTNMDEFAMGGSTENSAFGPTKNPHDETRVPGGTSGGSAASVAADLAAIGLGTDTGGSVRQPGSFCGVYGFKPTYGAISRSGLIAMGSSLDQLGINARSIEDIQAVFDMVKGPDPLDGTTLPAYASKSGNKTIGVPRSLVAGADAETVKEFDRGMEQLQKKGYEIVDIELPTAPHAIAAYYIIMPAEVSTNLSRFDAMRYGLHVDGENLFEDYAKTRGSGFGSEAKRRIILGTYVLSHGYYDAYYRKAGVLRAALVAEFDSVFEKVSAIATPTSPGPAFKIGEKNDPVSMYLEDIFTVSANLAGVPALSVPFGIVSCEGKNLPVGIQFMAQKRGEKTLFDAAHDLMGE